MFKSLLFHINIKFLFVTILLFHLLNSVLFNYVNLNYETYLRLLSNQVDYDFATSLTNKLLIIQRFQYFLLIFFIAIKLLIVSFAIYVAFELSNLKITFNDTLLIVLLSESTIILGDFIKFAYFLIYNIESLNQLKYFYPGSILNIIHENILPNYLLYALKYINAFYISQFFILIYLFAIKFPSLTLSSNIKIIISSYGSLFFLWELIVIFLQLIYN
jgi:hypothetical protein